MSNRISSPASNLLDRPNPSGSALLSENQTLVDQLVSTSVEEATKGSMLTAMLGAGVAYRLTRAGVMSFSLGKGGALLPLIARGGSYAMGLANESAVFAGIERGFHSLEGHSSTTSFGKDWARALINLGSIKLLGGAARGQNLLVQHLLTDLGMVGGQQLGAAFHLTERPQGNFAQQMVRAEALNWSMKAGMNLLQGLSPSLPAMEKSMDLYLRSRETDFSSRTRGPISPFPPLALEGSYGSLGVPSSPQRIRDSMESSGPSREHIVFAMGNRPGGSGVSKNFPTPEQVAQEIGRLHQSWLGGTGKIQIEGEGKEVAPANLDLGELQRAMWTLDRRPIVAGTDLLNSAVWGRLRPFFANLNNPPELYKRDLGHAYYLLGLSIVTGKPLDTVILPETAQVEVPKYSHSPFDLLYARHQWSTGDGRTLRWPQIVDQFFPGNESKAGEFAREAQGEDWMKRRGWRGISSTSSSSSATARSSPSSDPVRRRTLFDLSLNDVQNIIPQDVGGPPQSHLILTETVATRDIEHILNDGYSIGWWTRLHKQGAYQANILGKVADFSPEEVYNLLSKREEWTVFYPGFYLVERLSPPGVNQGIYRLGLKTPAGKIRMFSKQTIVPDELQVRWEGPTQQEVSRFDMEAKPDEKVVARIQGSITAAPSPSGKGSLVLYELFMTALQQGTGVEVDPFADLQRGQHATMARVPPLLTSLSAKLAANRDGRLWGISDPAVLAEYRNNRDALKGPEPEGVRYQPKVWVIEK